MLLQPDLLLHQAHHLSVSHLEMRRDQVLQAFEDVQTRSVALLPGLNHPQTRNTSRIASLSTILAEIRRLHSALDVLAMNDERVVASLPWLRDISHYQRLRLSAMLQAGGPRCAGSRECSGCGNEQGHVFSSRRV